MPAALAKGTMRRSDNDTANSKPLPALPPLFIQSHQLYAPTPRAAPLAQRSPYQATTVSPPEEHPASSAHAAAGTRQRQVNARNHMQEPSRKPTYTPLPIPGHAPANRTAAQSESNLGQKSAYHIPPQAHTKVGFPDPVYQSLARHLTDEALPVQKVPSGKPILVTATVRRSSVRAEIQTQARPQGARPVPPVPVGIDPAALAGRAAAAGTRRKPAPISTSASPLPPRSDSLPQGAGQSVPNRGPPSLGHGVSPLIPKPLFSSDNTAAANRPYGKYEPAHTRDTEPSATASKPYREKTHSGENSPIDWDIVRGVVGKFKASKWENKRNEAIKKANIEKDNRAHPMPLNAEDNRREESMDERRGRGRDRESTDQEGRHSSVFSRRSLSLTRLFKGKTAAENDSQPIPKWKEWRKKNAATSAAAGLTVKPQAPAPAERQRQNWGPFRAQEEARQSKKKAGISDPSNGGLVSAADTFAGTHKQLPPKAVQPLKTKLVVNGANTRDTTFGDFLTADSQTTPTMPEKPGKSHSPSPSWAERLMPKRRNSDSSDMSFACVGADQDHPRSRVRVIRCMICGNTGQSEAGLCNYCAGNSHLFTKSEAYVEKTDRQDSVPSMFLQDPSPPLMISKTLAPANRSSSIYTKRATQHRPTSAYSDPGNPFDRQTRVIEGWDTHFRDLDAWHAQDANHISITEQTDKAVSIPSSPERRGKKSDTTNPGKGHWPEPPPIPLEDLEYWPRKSFWLKTVRERNAGKAVQAENRNTNFYGFYDEILESPAPRDGR